MTNDNSNAGYYAPMRNLIPSPAAPTPSSGRSVVPNLPPIVPRSDPKGDVEVLSGGMLRWNAGGFSGSLESALASNDRPTGVQAKAHGQGYRMVNGVVEEMGDASGVNRFNTADLTNGQSGVLSTLTRGGRSIAPWDATMNDMVKIGGLDTTVENALRCGFLQKDARGGLINVGEGALREADGSAAAERAAQATAQADADRAAKAEANKLPGDLAESAHALLTANATQGTLTAAAVEVMESGELSPRTAAQLATEMGRGAEPENVASALELARQGYQEQASAYLAKAGVDPEGFAAWARQQHPTAFKAAMTKHVQTKDASAYLDLADKYLLGLDTIRPDLILGASFEGGGRAYMDNGKVMLSLPEVGTVTWQAALRSGLIGRPVFKG